MPRDELCLSGLLSRPRRRPRVALLSPLPPDQSGAAKFITAICESLGELVELHVFTETTDALELQNVASIRSVSTLPRLAPRFDQVLSIVANSSLYLQALQYLLDHSAACIVHDGHLLGLYVAAFGEERALAVAKRELGRPVTCAEFNAWAANERTLEALFLGEVVAAARPMITHSPVTARVMSTRFGRTSIYVPYPVCRKWDPTALQPEARIAARKRLGFAPDEVAIVVLGVVRQNKAPVECIEAIEILRSWGVQATLYFAGSRQELPGQGESLAAHAAWLGVGDFVRFADGFLPEQIYRDYLVAADLALTLRSYDFGGISGALLDCAAAGLPTVTNVSLCEAADIPAMFMRTVPDHLSPVLIAEELAELHGAFSSADREPERRAFCEARRVETYVRRLCEALDLSVPARRAA